MNRSLTTAKHIPKPLVLALFAPSQVATVYQGIPTDNTPNIPPKMMEEEKRAFQERVSQKHRDIMAAERLAGLRMQKDFLSDENYWWNKLKTMTEPEMKLMPMGFIKKYGSYVTNLQRYDREFHMEENKNIYDYYQQVKNLKKLQTDEEKSLMLAEFRVAMEQDVVTMAGLVREEGDYMRRQPRVVPDKLSYNVEQYGRYAKQLSAATKKDQAKSESFYKMVKYVKKNKDNL